MTNLKRIQIFVLILPILLFAGNYESKFDKILEYYNVKEYEKALNTIDKFLDKYPENNLVPKAELIKAECLIRTEKYNIAKTLLADFLYKNPNSDMATRARYFYAIALIKTANYDDGVKYLCRVINKKASATLDSLAYIGLKAYSSYASLDKMYKLAGYIDKNSEVASDIFFEYADNFMETKIYSKAMDAFEMFINEFPNSPRTKEAKKKFEKASKKWNRKFRVAILAPLSGEYKKVGLSFVRGAKLAFTKYNNENNSKIGWKVIDTKGEPVEAVLAVKKLLKNRKVHAIIGPVLSQEVVAAGAAMGDNQIPMFAPVATGYDITKVYSNLFQMTVPPKVLAWKIADYAVNVLKIKEFVIVAPLSEYGKIMAESFKERLNFLNAECSILKYYQEGSTNFRSMYMEMRKEKIQQLQYQKFVSSGNTSDDDSKRLSKSVVVDDTTEVLMGGIFMPCNKEDVIALASQADHYLIKGQLLGTTPWYSDDILKMRNSSLEGAIVGINYIPKPSCDLWTEFSSAYNKKYGVEPDHVAGKSFDAAKLLGTAFKNINLIVSYKKINSTIKKTKNFDGVAGTISLNPKSNVNEETAILRILDNKFVRVQ